MTGHNEPRRSRRVWTADEIGEQLDEVAEVIRQGVPQLISGIFFGAPAPRRPKSRQDRTEGSR